jgi:hypothetical protein
MKSDEIFKLLQKCNRNSNKPDLHSFTADVQNGTVYVECRGFEVYIESRIYGEREKVYRWVGNTMAAANRLAALNIDLLSVEM